MTAIRQRNFITENKKNRAKGGIFVSIRTGKPFCGTGTGTAGTITAAAAAFAPDLGAKIPYDAAYAEKGRHDKYCYYNCGSDDSGHVFSSVFGIRLERNAGNVNNNVKKRLTFDKAGRMIDLIISERSS